MNNGMSKFTKGCLITALVTFIIGFFLCGVGALFGGFRMLDGMDIEGITGIPFVFHRSASGDIQYGFGWNDDWDDDWDDIDWSQYKNWSSINDSDKGVELDLTADTLRSLNMEMGACELYIMESENEHVRIEISGETKYFRYLEENNGSLSLTHRTGHGFWNWSQNKIAPATKVYLYLPEGTMLSELSIEIGAGNMESIGLQAREISMEVGAGACDVDGLTATGEIDLTVGAGRITLDSLRAGELDMEVGAGGLYIADAQVERETDLNLGVGNAELGGLFIGNMNLECNMGSVSLKLDDAEADHNYEIECSIGNVHIGSRSYTSLANDVSISNGSSSTYDIECSMGDVSIEFAQ